MTCTEPELKRGEGGLPSRHLVFVGWLVLLMMVAGCAPNSLTVPERTKGIVGGPNVLRVGITPNVPPMIFKKGDQYQGIEADLARRLGEFMNRKVHFIEVPWERQIEALMADETDIIMSNMSITSPRQIRINFSSPYMRSGQMALVRRSDAGKYKLFLFSDRFDLGVQEGTTGDYFAQQYLQNAKRVAFKDPVKAATQVAANKLDMVIHDAPVVWWLAAENEANGLTVMDGTLTEEHLAWGIAKDDELLLQQVNTFLKAAYNDGTLGAVLKRWIPQMSQ